MKCLLWFFVLIVLMMCAQRAKAQPPAAGAVRSGQTQVQNATNGNCLYNNAGVLGDKTCGGGGGGPAGSAGMFDYTVNGTTFGASARVQDCTVATCTDQFSNPVVAPLGIKQTITDLVSQSPYLLQLSATLNPAADTTSQFNGQQFFVDIPAMNSKAINNTTRGIDFEFFHNGTGTFNGRLYGKTVSLFNESSGTFTYADGMDSVVENDGTGTITKGYGFTATIFNDGGGAITQGYGFYGNAPGNQGVGSTLGYYVAFFSEPLETTIPITNAFDQWFDEQGVYVVHAINTFNSVFQARPALYNPQFTKFTAGTANFERCIPGCQWESNEAWIRNEAGGTGTLRRLGLGSAGLDVSSGNVAQQFTLNEISASAVAPGASTVGIHVRAGTNPGTCKVTVNGGTTAAEITLVDNVGVAGC